MFTRCSECLTVFHVSAAELRAADGSVVCGECGADFDALESLSETLPTEPVLASRAPLPSQPKDRESSQAPAGEEDTFLDELESLIGADDQDQGSENTRGMVGTRGEPYVGDQLLDQDDDETPAGDAGNLEATDTDDELPVFATSQLQPRLGLAYLVALAAALLVLGGAWAHTQRATLLRHPAGEALMGPVYALLGITVTAQWSPAAFAIKTMEGKADPAHPEQLVVGVEFQNNARFAQPYPVLRVILEDRFGRRVSSHDITPADYLAGDFAKQRLAANGRIRATLNVPDPGARTANFRINFCIQSGAGELMCSN